MGNLFGCIDETVHIERLNYDMTPVKTKHLPIIWMIGPPGTGKNVFAYNLSKDFHYEHIKISDLLKNESLNDTERSKIIKDSLENQNKRIPDVIVVDLIKEAMLLKAKQANGYVINGFPRTSKQAFLFVNEIGNVDIIIYLHGKIDEMAQRVNNELSTDLTNEVIKKNILNYMKEIKEATQRFGPKIEKIYVEKPERDCYNDIEAAISARISDVKVTIKKQINVLHESFI